MAIPDGSRLFVGDGGLETTMIFREGIELPSFAAFPLLREPAGREALRRYYGGYAGIARDLGAGFEVFAAAAVDMVSAYTLCYVEEAIGIVRAAAATGTPVTIGFTLETDGKLPNDELDEATDLDDGAPAELAAEYLALEPHLPAIRVLGGCCGTDHRHVARICETWPWTAPDSR